ncbi:MAG TPA: MJ0042-type zinc finger domain-containing protein, partial [Steroidobacteraceae bacterium]
MYTQCMKCETVFRLSAEVLRAAGGQVRCGRCGEVFNALARLAEDPSAFPAGESSLEMETRANQILESAVPPLQQPGASSGSSQEIIEIEDIDSSGVDVARLQLVEKFVEDMPPPPTSASVSAEVRKAPAPPAPPPRPPPPAAVNPKPAPAPASAPATAPATTAAAARARAHSAAPAAVAPAAAASATPGAAAAAAPASASPAAPASRRTPATAPTPAAAQAPAAAPAPVPSARADEALLDDGSMEFTLPPGELDRVFVERLA